MGRDLDNFRYSGPTDVQRLASSPGPLRPSSPSKGLGQEVIGYLPLLCAQRFSANPSTRFRKKKKKKSKAEEVVETVEKVEAKLSQTADNRTPAQIAYDKIQEQRVSSPSTSI